MKKQRILLITAIIAITIFSIAGCGGKQSENQSKADSLIIADSLKKAQCTEPNDSLSKLWETQQEMLTAESVCFDPVSNTLFVANMNGAPSDKKDKNGFISKLSPEGMILELKWITGISDPKGMGVFNGKLFVTDIDQVVEIDIANRKIVKKYDVKGARFLNDITIDNAGVVYISDSGVKNIYLLKDGKIELFVEAPELEGVNGLLAENNTLLAGTKNAIYSVNPLDKTITLFIDNTGGIDGLCAIGDGRYLISDWSGKIQIVAKDKPNKTISDTTPQNVNAADIWYVKEKQMLLVPTFFDNRVVAYKLSTM